MDLTTLTTIVMLAIAVLAGDAALHPPGAVFDAAVIGGKTDIDRDGVNAIIAQEVGRIAATHSIVAVPEMKVGSTKGVGFALAEAAKIEPVVIAFQQELGYEPDQVRVTLMGGTPMRALVTGQGLGGRVRTPPFDLVLEQRPDETLVALIHRAALAATAQIDPYLTALNLLQRHEVDKDFSDIEAIVSQTLARLPPTPVNTDRAMLLNLQGIIALFRNDMHGARRLFARAADSDPAGAVAQLNLALAEIQLDREPHAAAAMEQLIARLPTDADRIVRGTAHMTWGAALLGMRRPKEAEARLAMSVQIFPESSSALLLWSDAKRELGDTEGAEALRRRAFEMSGAFENYAELGALYFELPWREHAPLTRNQFSNPDRLLYN